MKTKFNWYYRWLECDKKKFSKKGHWFWILMFF